MPGGCTRKATSRSVRLELLDRYTFKRCSRKMRGGRCAQTYASKSSVAAHAERYADSDVSVLHSRSVAGSGVVSLPSGVYDIRDDDDSMDDDDEWKSGSAVGGEAGLARTLTPFSVTREGYSF